nr:immunoglobulin light chain junction region [Macaca mulatta]
CLSCDTSLSARLF